MGEDRVWCKEKLQNHGIDPREGEGIARSTDACPAEEEEIERSMDACPTKGRGITRSTNACPAEGVGICKKHGRLPDGGKRDCKKHRRLPGGGRRDCKKRRCLPGAGKCELQETRTLARMRGSENRGWFTHKGGHNPLSIVQLVPPLRRLLAALLEVGLADGAVGFRSVGSRPRCCGGCLLVCRGSCSLLRLGICALFQLVRLLVMRDSSSGEGVPTYPMGPGIKGGCCAHPNFISSGTHARVYVTRLGSVHLPGDARRTRMRRSRHLLFTTRRSRAVESPGSRGTGNENARHRIYNREIESPKVDGMGRTNETRARTGRPFLSIDRDVSDSLMPRISVNHGMTIMPLSGRTNDSEATKETILDPGGVKEHSTIFQRTGLRGLLDPPWIVGEESYLASEHEERVGEVAKGVGRLGWNEQTRIGAVGSTGRPDWQSGLSGLYRLIEMEFSWQVARSEVQPELTCMFLQSSGQKRKPEKQTRLVPNEETTLREASGGLLSEKRGKWRWCTVERLSACNHLITGESEGCKESLGSDGTTRQSRGKERRA
ncbi:hypothetical protein CRG98_029083 [Punica granatum]|uniref:Uncharacterized protein n=2 Tax=Punica granatum TaxID=22663 RepID=A0A2I0J2R6_PUNGR|nr:hypothetical protein CRG98_029083 [Punica granatum]